MREREVVDTTDEVHVDLEATEHGNVDLEYRHVAEKQVRVSNLFDENGELRLWETPDGWSGYELHDGQIRRVNVRDGERQSIETADLAQLQRAIESHIEREEAAGRGTFAPPNDPNGIGVFSRGGRHG